MTAPFPINETCQFDLRAPVLPRSCLVVRRRARSRAPANEVRARRTNPAVGSRARARARGGAQQNDICRWIRGKNTVSAGAFVTRSQARTRPAFFDALHGLYHSNGRDVLGHLRSANGASSFSFRDLDHRVNEIIERFCIYGFMALYKCFIINHVRRF